MSWASRHPGNEGRNDEFVRLYCLTIVAVWDLHDSFENLQNKFVYYRVWVPRCHTSSLIYI